MRNNLRVLQVAMLWIAGGLICTNPAAGSAANEVTDLRVLRMEDAMVLEISTAGEVTCRAFPLADPERLVIDCPGARLRLDWQVREMDDPLVQRIRAGQYRSEPRPVSRLVLDLKERAAFRIWEDDGVQVVEIKTGAMALPEAPEEYLPQDGFTLQSVPDGPEGFGIISRRIMLKAQGTDIRTILEAMSAFSGRNIISGPETKGEVHLRLRGLNWEEALNIILKTHGYEHRKESGMIFVSPLINAIPEEPITIPAPRAEDASPPFVPPAAVPERVLAARTPEPRGEDRHRDDAREGNEVQLPASGFDEEPAERETGPAKIPDPAEYRIDVKTTLLRADVSSLRDLPIDWATPYPPAAGTGRMASDTPVGTISSGRVGAAEALSRQLENLSRTDAATVLSVSRTSTTNNGEAQILVGRKIALPDPGEPGMPRAEPARVSISLLVSPRAYTDGTVTLHLHPEVVVIRPEGGEPGSVSITSGSADTQITVGDGETAVMSGLRTFIRTDGGGKGPGMDKDFLLLVTPTIVK